MLPHIFFREHRQLFEIVERADVAGPQLTFIEDAAIVGHASVGMGDELAQLRFLIGFDLFSRPPLRLFEPIQQLVKLAAVSQPSLAVALKAASGILQKHRQTRINNFFPARHQAIEVKKKFCLEAVFDRRRLEISNTGGQRPPLNQEYIFLKFYIFADSLNG